MSNFEKASRLRLRYKTAKGVITTEDLWDLTLEDLNVIAIALSKQVNEESFIKTKTTSNKEVDLKFEIVKHVINTRLSEEEKRKEAQIKREKRAKLLELIAQKENEGLMAKGIEELRKEVELLDQD